MPKKIKVKITIIILSMLIVTALVCRSIYQNRIINLLGETVVYSMYTAACEIDLCFSNESADVSYQLTQAALSLQKAHSQLDSALASSLVIDSRKSFVGNMGYVAQFMLTGGSANGVSVRPASEINGKMNVDETMFYQKLSEKIKAVFLSKMIFEEEGYNISFQPFSLDDLKKLANDFQTGCSIFFPE